jgi:poly(3-hydroxybutyrate) depolymerase
MTDHDLPAFEIDVPRSPGGSGRLTVYHHDPGAPDAPIAIVLHGRGRNGDGYFKVWWPFAQAHGFRLLVPSFGRDLWPRDEDYNLLGLVDADGRFDWQRGGIIEVLEALPAIAASRFGARRDRVSVYGHSAGSQILHRFAWVRPDFPFERLICANAGWYTLPDPAVAFPVGLNGLGLDAASIQRTLALPATILLGEADSDPTHHSLPKHAEALAQGAHRFARGQAFAAAMQAAGSRWEVATVPGVGHSNLLMAPAAVDILRHAWRTR